MTRIFGVKLGVAEGWAVYEKIFARQGYLGTTPSTKTRKLATRYSVQVSKITRKNFSLQSLRCLAEPQGPLVQGFLGSVAMENSSQWSEEMGKAIEMWRNLRKAAILSTIT